MGIKVSLKVRRYNPEGDSKGYWETFTVDNCHRTDTVLDVLHRIKWEQDGTLGLRRSCAHGVCGSDAMRINGANALACKTLLQRLKSANTNTMKLQVEPILGLPVLKDLIVDMEPFFEHYRSVLPFFISKDPAPANGRERLQTQEDRAVFDDTTKCILCAACTSSCPSFWANGKYVGPAAIVQAHRFIFDSRDQAAEQRLAIVGDTFGVWRCRTNFNCTNSCPRDIEVTRAIAEVKVALMNQVV